MTYPRLASVVLSGVAAIVVLFAAAVLLVPRLLHWETVIVLTGSMEPALGAGGIAYVDTSVDTAVLVEGDIVTFRRADGAIVTHRIVSREQGPDGLRYQTRGDANAAADPLLVRPADVMGRVRVFVPRVGAWSRWLQEGANFQLLLGPIAAAVVLNELWSVARRFRGREEAPAGEPSVAEDAPAAGGWQPVALVIDGLPRLESGLDRSGRGRT